MSYRPQIKKSDGTMQDLPLDAETVKGKNVSAEINNIISGAQVVGKATNATNDGKGRNIADTYALKSEVGNDEFVTYYTIVNPSSLTDRIYFSYEASEAFYTISNLAGDMSNNYYSLEGGVAASGYWDGQIVVGLYVDKSTSIPGTLKAYCIGGTKLQPSTVTISSSNKLNTRAQG